MNEVQPLPEILQLVEKYGLATVLLIALLFLIYKFAVSVYQWVQSGKITINTAIPENHDDILMKSIGSDAEISNILTELMHHYDVGWVTIWQFHNGMVSIAGVPFMKISVTHEAAKANRYLFGQDYRDLPISLFISNHAGGKDIMCESCIMVDSSDVMVNTAISNAMKSQGISRAYCFLVKGAFGNLMGLLTLSFSGEVGLSNSDQAEIYSQAARIAVYLEALANLNNLKLARKSSV